MSEKVYVSGHKNPDTDSICSSIAYANLMNQLQKYDATPVRLGNVSLETQYVLDYFNVPSPELLKTIRQTVCDLNFDNVVKFTKNFTLKTAWEMMKSKSLKTSPVVDEEANLLGIISSTSIIEGYMGNFDESILKTSQTPVENIVEVLNAKVVHHGKTQTCNGNIQIASMSTKEMKVRINKDDIVLVGGDRHEAIVQCIENEAGILVLTGDLKLSEELSEKIREANITTILTPFNTYNASQIIIQAVPVSYVMQTQNIVTVGINDTINDVKALVSETRYHNYPILDDNNKVVGTLSRYEIVNDSKKNIIQVDHNERGQAVDGIEEANILEVIDHHCIADFQTNTPLYFRAEPVGCSATIVSKCYLENNIEITKEMAGIMLGRIISDTLLFKSPTCTHADRKAAEYLAKIADVNIEEFGMEMFKAGTSLKRKNSSRNL